MVAKGLVLYLITGFFSAVTYAYYIHHYSLHDVVSEQSVLSSSNSRVLQQRYRSEAKIWPELKFGWEIVVATAIGFLGSACGTVGGVGGGGIFVPTLTLIVGFDTKSAAAISKFIGATKTSCMIMGASASSFWYNLRVPHPCRQVAIIDYDLALLFQPMLMLGITFGVSLSVVFPHWLITVLIIILFLGTSSRSFAKAIMMWKDETILKKAMEEEKQQTIGQVLIDAEYEPLVPPEEKTTLQIIKANLNTSRISVLLLVWIGFLLLQVIKNDTKACSPFYWVLNFLQLPVALSIFAFECVRLYRESKKRRIAGNQELICEAAIEWTATNLAFCALCGLLGGTVGGLLGSGGGFILGPLLLEIGVIPQVASATATFVMMFSSSLSVVEFYLLKRFPMHYALYMMTVSILAGFWGQFVVRKLVTILKRASIIVFILSAVIFASAVIMGIDGIEKSIQMISNHEFMGFLDFCSSQ